MQDYRFAVMQNDLEKYVLVPSLHPTPREPSQPNLPTGRPSHRAQQHIADLGVRRTLTLYLRLPPPSPAHCLGLAAPQDGMARAGPPMMVAFIDGEALTFAPHHIAQGHEGAQHCLDQLHTSIYAGMDMMGQQQREDAMEEGHSKPLLLLFYLYDQATMQAQLKHAGHPQAAAALPDFVSGLQDCVVLNAPTARRHERLLGTRGRYAVC